MRTVHTGTVDPSGETPGEPGGRPPAGAPDSPAAGSPAGSPAAGAARAVGAPGRPDAGDTTTGGAAAGNTTAGRPWLEPGVGLAGQVVVLAVLAATVGLRPAGWAVGFACGVVTAGLLARAVRAGARLGPADRVTLTRAALVGGVAALVATAYHRSVPVTVLVGLAAVALALDAVDGYVARRTGTVSPLGARFDMEVDAFLIFVLSAYVARDLGGWVLAIGFARYAYVLAGWWLPWLRRPVPPRYWCKVVAAIQGVTLTVAASGLLPDALATVAVAAALVLLAESFGRDIWWQAHQREKSEQVTRRRVAGRVVTVLAVVVVWCALLLPDKASQVSVGTFLRVPVEGLVLLLVLVALPRRARRIVAPVAGVLLGVLVIVRFLDMGFIAGLDRPFNPLTDWGNVQPAVGVLADSIGRARSTAVVVGAATVLLLVLVAITLATGRMSRTVAGRRGAALRTVAGLGAVWVVAAVVGVPAPAGPPVAARSAAAVTAQQVGQIRDAVRDRRIFAAAVADDAFRDTPADQLLTGLRGKDVLLVFVESYGRVAVQDSTIAAADNAVLDDGTRRLAAAGFGARTGFLSSPTFGGISWLAHSTLQSGLWIDNQKRYNELVRTDRFTLSDAFSRAGWRTVGDIPSNHQDWPEGYSFYHYDTIYDARNVGYEGPTYSYADMPDQYTLSVFQRLELASPHQPVMAELDLVSSHTPWAPLPRMVDWSAVGDGSIFDGQPEQGQQPGEVWKDSEQVRQAYGESIRYTMNTLVSFVQTYPDPNLVMVVLGDHEPATIVSGEGASRDVPISVIAHDPSVLDRISTWGWTDGLRPAPDAPVWRMDAFRDKFLTAYGPGRP